MALDFPWGVFIYRGFGELRVYVFLQGYFGLFQHKESGFLVASQSDKDIFFMVFWLRIFIMEEFGGHYNVTR